MTNPGTLRLRCYQSIGQSTKRLTKDDTPLIALNTHLTNLDQHFVQSAHAPYQDAHINGRQHSISIIRASQFLPLVGQYKLNVCFFSEAQNRRLRSAVEWAQANGYRQEAAAGENGHHPSAYNRRCPALLQLAKYIIREHRCAAIVRYDIESATQWRN